jgi:anti-sigma-K factor RskA
VEATGDHELAAGYALDALEHGERRAFEAHLGSCTVCAEELPSLRAAAASLAYGVAAESAPAALRAELLGTLSEHQASPVVPLWRRAALPVASALAVGAAAAGIAVWAWPSQRSYERPVVVPIEGRPGSLVLTRDNGAFLVVSGLPAAPQPTTYEAWVIHAGHTRPAGTFRGGPGRTIVLLQRRVPPGARVAVSLEPRGGSRTRTGPMLFRTERA